ncbi:MAG: hypothetical protein LBL48_02690, partial [Azoarcus sp.]|nr:hypothetical protein [Azoarcus sp.]
TKFARNKLHYNAFLAIIEVLFMGFISNNQWVENCSGVTNSVMADLRSGPKVTSALADAGQKSEASRRPDLSPCDVRTPRSDTLIATWRFHLPPGA